MKLKLFLLLFVGFGAFAQNHQTLYIDGKLLKDHCGETVVLKGVNTMSVYVVNPAAQFAEIAQTGANSVRIQIAMNTPVATIQQWLDACLAAKMIPILEFQELTSKGVGDVAWYIAAEGGDWGKQSDAAVLTQAANYWTSNAIKTLLLQYQKYLIINIANEPNGAWTTDDPNNWHAAQAAVDRLSYFNANKTAITALRNAGYTCPLMIDSTANGHDVVFLTQYANDLQNWDTLHNIVFSIHAYWPTVGGNTYSISDAVITSRMDALGALTQPVVIGELASHNVGGGVNPISYNLIMQKAAQYNLGYHVWWWGGNAEANNELSMTTAGTYATLTGDGLVMAKTSQYSIQNTSVRPYSITHNGICNPVLSVTDISKKEVAVYPNPAKNTLNFSEELSDVKITDASGKIVKQISAAGKSVNVSALTNGTYIITANTKQGNTITKKIIKE